MASLTRELRPTWLLLWVLAGMAFSIGACQTKGNERSMVVTVTAYNSVRSQTEGDPSLAAWGDRLKPGMKVVAVSKDLIDEGLTRGTSLRIEGLKGEYVVLDRTASKFTKRVDIYMGEDVEKAKEFGAKKLRITWRESAGS